MRTKEKLVDALIKWAVPAACAALVGAWQAAQPQNRWLVLIAASLIAAICSTAVHSSRAVSALKTRIEAIEDAQAQRDRQQDITRKAFRAMLDDDMGKLYTACLVRGYTTEDERRRYDRLQRAYHENGGNGEAERREKLFHAIATEEAYRVSHGQNI